MQISLYAREYYSRGKMRFIIAGCLFIWLIVLTLWSGVFFSPEETLIPGWQSWVSVFLLILFAWAYRKRVGGKVPDIVEAVIQDDMLSIGEQQFPWASLVGFAVEAKESSGELHNLIICTDIHRMIYTFADTQEHIISFLQTMQWYSEQLETVTYSTMELVLRRCKI